MLCACGSEKLQFFIVKEGGDCFGKCVIIQLFARHCYVFAGGQWLFYGKGDELAVDGLMSQLLLGGGGCGDK